MPRRPLQSGSPVAKEAIAKALARGRLLDSTEEAAFEAFRRSARIRQVHSKFIIKFRDGVAAFRRFEGSRGADLTDHPLLLEVQRAERDFLTLKAKLLRWPPIELGLRSRLAKAAKLESQTLELLALHEHKGSGAAAVVAKALGKTPQYVRRIRNKKRT